MLNFSLKFACLLAVAPHAGKIIKNHLFERGENLLSN